MAKVGRVGIFVYQLHNTIAESIKLNAYLEHDILFHIRVGGGGGWASI